MSGIQAVLFDMDGVLIDSQTKWQPIVEQMYRGLFPRLSEGEIKYLAGQVIGRSIEDEFLLLQKNMQLELSWAEFSQRYDQSARLLYQEKAELSHFLPDLLKILSPDYKLGLVSNSTRSWIDLVLDRFDLGKYFNAIVSVDDVKGQGKPAPDIYLLAAERLQVQPAKCLVFEDSRPGVAAAQAAGMICIGYCAHGEREDVSESDLIIDNFQAALEALATFDAEH